MSTEQKPTIVYVPGAWHNHHAYDPTTALLDAAGYKTHGVDLVSPGSPPPFKTFADDVAAVRAALIAHVDAGEDVVLVVHSYSGVVGTEAVEGLAPKDRKEGKGAVVGLVYIAAFMVLEGQCLNDFASPGGDAPWWFKWEGEYLYCADPHQIFYNDLSASTAAALAAQLTHHPSATFDARTTHAGWRHIPTTYVLCDKDNAIPVQGQDALVQQARGAGAEILEVRLDASHSPMISQPEAVAVAVRRAAGEVGA
ncbi:hypothetical protein LTR16_001123 [Cryomyces antarcticus]|uniref:AB hydrolase-1 domain-containing protein n=1 Tax=Cryomyces antarcticus TaxID=329879 RepID=A0ABR0M8T7_9PEZI|nr:hypothetical protein LTR39_001220 [Cryomyces antarcticus]KAK5019522.1 hypothetical protein LTR60_001091 [Cryomyces antarcticus]KAK5295322.1 hypothetical protein LTR16_001123 [Cryomyces antarcticus]